MSNNNERTVFGRLRDKLFGNRADKREWRAYRKRVEALPREYRIVMRRIQKFLWTCGGAVDDQSWRVLYDICELFEDSAAAGRDVLQVTGDDVAHFATEMLAATGPKTWIDLKADKMNATIHKALGRKSNNGK
jgi:DNA-binding ferritin-like protein (Dps family)